MTELQKAVHRAVAKGEEARLCETEDREPIVRQWWSTSDKSGPPLLQPWEQE